MSNSNNAKSALKNIAGLALAVPARVLDSVILNPLYAGYNAQGLNDISAVQTLNQINKQKSFLNNVYTGLVASVQVVIQLPALIVGFLASLLPRAYDKFSSSKPAEKAATDKSNMSTGGFNSVELGDLENSNPAEKAATEEINTSTTQSKAEDSKVVGGPLAQPNFLYGLFAEKCGPNAIVEGIENVVSAVPSLGN